MKDLGEASIILIMETGRDIKRKTQFSTQEKHWKNMLEWFGMGMARPMNTLMQKAPISEKELEVEINNFCQKSVPYLKAISFLMYLTIGTRPNIGFPVGNLSKFCERPEEKQWIAAKNVLWSLCGSKSLEMCFDGENSIVSFGYCDADCGGDVKSGKSTSGYLFMMECGAIA